MTLLIFLGASRFVGSPQSLQEPRTSSKSLLNFFCFMFFPFALNCCCVSGGLWAGRDEADAHQWLQVNSPQASQGFPTRGCSSPSQPCCNFHTLVPSVCSLVPAVSSCLGLAANRVFFPKDASTSPFMGV